MYGCGLHTEKIIKFATPLLSSRFLGTPQSSSNDIWELSKEETSFLKSVCMEGCTKNSSLNNSSLCTLLWTDQFISRIEYGKQGGKLFLPCFGVTVHKGAKKDIFKKNFLPGKYSNNFITLQNPRLMIGGATWCHFCFYKAQP